MDKRILALVLLPALFLSKGAYLQETSPSDELAAGIRQFHEGDIEAAVVTLDTAAQRLRNDASGRKDLARAYLYLSMAKLNLSQPDAARRDMREALRADATLTLNPKLYPPLVLKLYEETREEVAAEAKATPPSAAPVAAGPTAVPGPSGQKRKGGGGGKVLLIIGGGAAVAGVAVAAAGGGGSSGPASSPTTTTGSLVLNLNVGPEGVQRCTQGISIYLTATNTTGAPIRVNTASSVRRVTSGKCTFASGVAFADQEPLTTQTIPAGARDLPLINYGHLGSCMPTVCLATECRAEIEITIDTSVGSFRATDSYDVSYPGTPACLSFCTTNRALACLDIISGVR
jgi:hypothetical protein